MVKNPPARDTGSIPGWGRSPGGGHGNPLQCSCLGDSMNRGAWLAAVYGGAQSQASLSRPSSSGTGTKELPGGSVGKEPASSAGDTGDVCSIPGSGRFPGEGHDNPLQYPCLENPVDRGAWWATVHSITESWTRLKQLSTRHSGLKMLRRF